MICPIKTTGGWELKDLIQFHLTIQHQHYQHQRQHSYVVILLRCCTIQVQKKCTQLLNRVKLLHVPNVRKTIFQIHLLA